MQADFDSFLNKNYVFDTAWPLVASDIVKVARKRTSDGNKKKITEDLKVFLKANENCETQTLAILLLPFMFNKLMKTPARPKENIKNWYPDQQEVLENFVILIRVSNF